MKTLKKTIRLAACVGVLAVSATSVLGFQQILTVDENGNGTYASQPLPYTVAIDPISGMNTLRYDLPAGFNVLPGDVALYEPDNVTVLSDILRFDGQGHLFFFSDRESGETGPFDLADVAQMPGLQAGYAAFIEQGPEGNNGYLYNPTPGQPGYDAVFARSYNFISDVPEPGALMLTGLGGLVLALRARRQ